MTQKEFDGWPWLLWERQVISATGYARSTLAKMVDCGVLRQVKLPGMGQARYLKKQVAELLELQVNGELLAREPFLMPEKSVVRWTGLSGAALEHLVKARSLKRVKPAGSRYGKYRKQEVAGLIGLEGLV